MHGRDTSDRDRYKGDKTGDRPGDTYVKHGPPRRHRRADLDKRPERAGWPDHRRCWQEKRQRRIDVILKNIHDPAFRHGASELLGLRRSGPQRLILDELGVIRRGLVADYLVNTDASLTQIADMLGYGDQAAFTSAFRRWYGEPPGRWRKNQIEPD